VRITLNRFTARLLLILLAPIVPLAYDGDRAILIAVWATWAGV
jgi:hypothetical protein